MAEIERKRGLVRIKEPLDLQDEGIPNELAQDGDLLNGLEPSEINAVTLYLREVRKTPLLTPEEERELASQIKEGKETDLKLNSDGNLSSQDKDALEKTILAGKLARKRFIKANGRLVVSMAKKYIGRGVPFGDIIQEGNIGLMKAVDRFDHTRGFRFSTYATWWIQQAICRALPDQGRTIRIPVHIAEEVRKINRIARELSRELRREPTEGEIAKELGIEAERVEKVRRWAWRPLSLDEKIDEEGEEGASKYRSFSDQKEPGPDEAASDILLGEEMREALGTLSPRERLILELRFGLRNGGKGYSLEEVGQRLGVTRERVRQIQAEALRKLRHPSRSRKLKHHLK